MNGCKHCNEDQNETIRSSNEALQEIALLIICTRINHPNTIKQLTMTCHKSNILWIIFFTTKTSALECLSLIMSSKGQLFSWCGVCCPKRNNFRLVLTIVVLWSLVFAFFKSFFLRPSEPPRTESNNYDIARIQSEILRKNTLTGMNINTGTPLLILRQTSGHKTAHRWQILSLNTEVSLVARL